MSLHRRRSWPVATAFVAVIALQTLIAVISIDVLSSVRAYVAGESLYSKGHKDAQFHLAAYTQSHAEKDYRLFLRALASPLGYRVMREELQKPRPNMAVVRQALRDAGSDPADIDGAIRLFQWFHRVPLMAAAIATWTEGDERIEEMRTLVERAHQHVLARDFDSPEVRALYSAAPLLNERITQLNRKFSDQLGEASRQTRRALSWANLALAVMLALAGVEFIRRNARAQARAANLELRTEALEVATRTDPLTSVANRLGFMLALRRLLEACRDFGVKGAVFYIDLDGFKAINDTAGHDAGDAVLATVARMLGETVRGNDVVARVGGDEFAVVAYGLATAHDAQALAAKMMEVVASIRVPGHEHLVIGATVGACLLPDPRLLDAESAVRRADELMLAAKRTAKGSFRMLGEYESGLNEGGAAAGPHPFHPPNGGE